MKHFCNHIQNCLKTLLDSKTVQYLKIKSLSMKEEPVSGTRTNILYKKGTTQIIQTTNIFTVYHLLQTTHRTYIAFTLFKILITSSKLSLTAIKLHFSFRKSSRLSSTHTPPTTHPPTKQHLHALCHPINIKTLNKEHGHHRNKCQHK